MTTQDLLRSQIDNVGKQIQAVFSGLSDSEANQRTINAMMTPREMIVHLAECCIASQKGMAGEEHEWGSYQAAEGATLSELMATYQSERTKAVDALMSGDPDRAAHLVSDYIVLHEAYHVGQMCSIRLSLDKDWNAYSIYGM